MNATAARTVLPRRLVIGGGIAIVMALTLAACGSSPSASTTTTKVHLTGSITVSAASSLTAVFTQLATTFRSLHPGTTVAFNFGSSGTLATQIQQGAPADVFASASPGDMQTVQTSGDIEGSPVTFARNSLEIVVKPGNPLGIHSLADLTKANVVALCVVSAPCGATAEQALKKAHVTIPTSKVTLGQDVDTTLSEVTTGDAEAAVVYVTNAKSVGSQGEGVPIPSSVNVTTSYPIAVIKSTKNKPLAQAWIAYVLSPTAQKVLHQASFLPPT
jgi:molybdate transport system substrate-binding protein